MITKQRSLTPEKITEEQQQLHRSLTPEKYRHKNSSDGSQGSLFVKQSSGSGSRSSTLERQNFEEKQPMSSRSSSSSSYSGGGGGGGGAGAATGDHCDNTAGFRRTHHHRQIARTNESRIRRSR